MIDVHAIRQRWEAVGAKLDERGRRLFAAIEVRTAGRGGLAIVSKITGLARSTINRGEDDLGAELQKLADESGLVLHVHHYPPGTSKWNKIEHRLFCHITQNWRGRPLTDRLAVVELIAANTTKTGLKVESALDARSYKKGIKVSKAAMKCLNITGDQFHPEWNYTVNPRQPP